MGVELENGGGDNSGSHSGVRYFTCRPGHGVFLPPSKVKRPAQNHSYTLRHNIQCIILPPR